MSKGIPLDDALLSVGPGWADILIRLYAKLPKSVCVEQVKEKWGSLHFYIGFGSNRTFNLIDAAERESEITCEVCGKPGKIYTEGWYVCRCPECHEKEEK